MVPFQPPAPLTYAGYAQGAMDRVVGDCAEDPGCASAYPNLGEEWTQLVEGLRRAPAEVVLQDERDSSRRAVDDLVAAGVSKKRRREKGTIDAAAACVILQDWLDEQAG